MVDPARQTRQGDSTDYKHRSRVNLIAAVGILVLLAIVYGTVKLFFDQQQLDACIASGRRNCVDLGAQPRDTIIVPTR